MNNYSWILFDADDTLFHFDAFGALTLMFSRWEILFTQEDYEEYQALNQALWVEYQNGKINSLQLQCQRFELWAKRLNCSAQELNNAFLEALLEICLPLDGAVSLLHALKGKVKMGIITNGFTYLQQTRLERTGLHEHFEFLVISEEIGVAKPHPAIFIHALNLMGNPPLEKVLMVGDNASSDILGGINAGIDTCWLNRDNKVLPAEIKPTYQVTSLKELESLLVESRVEVFA